MDDPPQSGHLLESKLGSIQVLSCYVVELRVEQLCFALRSLGRVRDLDPGASFLLALQQGLTESDIRVKDDLGVHSNGLGGRFRLEERQVLPIVLDPDLKVTVWVPVNELKTTVERVAVVSERRVEKVMECTSELTMSFSPITYGEERACEISCDVQLSHERLPIWVLGT